MAHPRPLTLSTSPAFISMRAAHAARDSPYLGGTMQAIRILAAAALVFVASTAASACTIPK